MADGLVRMGVKGGDEFARLSKQLREQGDGRLQERLRSRIRTAGRPVQREISAKARALRVTGSKGGTARPKGSKQLRARVAGAVGTSVTRRGIRFVVDGGKVDPRHGAALVSYLDADPGGNFKRWRYPVFNTGVWKQNRSSGGFFFATVRARRGVFERAVTAAMDDTVRELS